MSILELRILPPIAIGRLKSSSTPLEAFELLIPEDRPLDRRHIVPRDTFLVDPITGELSKYLPERIRFKDPDQRIRPVAPFLEVFAVIDDQPDELVSLTLDLLKAHRLSLSAVHWSVEVGNIKAFRRTGSSDDKIIAKIAKIKDHKSHALLGVCKNFIAGKTLPLGSVRFIKPTVEFPQVRLRFTPATGKVYGASRERHSSATSVEPDPVINSDDLVLYDAKRKTATWHGYAESNGPTLTNPGAIFAGYDTPDAHVSWGYLDDECDGFVTVTLEVGRGKVLSAHAHLGAGPPAFAPDTLPVRVVSDEIEQILLGPEVEGEVGIEEAEEIVRRALETVRVMNTAVMNGNSIDGRPNEASNMVGQDANDFGRLFEPIMATSLVDKLAVIALHERIFNGLTSGAAPWFSDALRRPEEIGDLSNQGRRKMLALMRNADGRALTLTHRQINTVIKAAAAAMFQPAAQGHSLWKRAIASQAIEPANLTAQLHYRGVGNPFSVLP